MKSKNKKNSSSSSGSEEEEQIIKSKNKENKNKNKNKNKDSDSDDNDNYISDGSSSSSSDDSAIMKDDDILSSNKRQIVDFDINTIEEDSDTTTSSSESDSDESIYQTSSSSDHDNNKKSYDDDDKDKKNSNNKRNRVLTDDDNNNNNKSPPKLGRKNMIMSSDDENETSNKENINHNNNNKKLKIAEHVIEDEKILLDKNINPIINRQSFALLPVKKDIINNNNANEGINSFSLLKEISNTNIQPQIQQQRQYNNNNNNNNNYTIPKIFNYNDINTLNSVEQIVSSYLFSFIKQNMTRNFEYTKLNPIDKHLLYKNITSDWIVTIDPIGREAVVVCTKSNTFIMIKNGLRLNNTTDEFLVYPSVLKSQDGGEFILIGTWCRENGSDNHQEIYDIFYPHDLYSYDEVELPRYTDPKEWKLPNLNDKRLKTPMKVRYAQLAKVIQDFVELKPVSVPSSYGNQYFEIRSKPIFSLINVSSNDNLESYKQILLNCGSNNNTNGIICIDPNHKLDDNYKSRGQYLIQNNLFQTIDAIILPANRPLSGVDEYYWKENMKDEHDRFIFPLFLKRVVTKQHNYNPGCHLQHSMEEFGFLGRGHIENSTNGSNLYKELNYKFAAMKDNIKPIVVSCIIPVLLQSTTRNGKYNNNNEVDTSDLWIHKIKVSGIEPTDQTTAIQLFKNSINPIQFNSAIDYLFNLYTK